LEIQKIESIIEALLFASGDALSIDHICDILEEEPLVVQTAIDNLMNAYNFEKRGIKLIRVGSKYQMATRGEYAEYVQRIVEPRKRNPLSKATLEVLAIVAYKQPVTRSTLEKIRGVSCDNSVARLLELGLIEEKGRLDAPGRPALFGTTDEFLRSFSISSISELPPLEDYVIDDILVVEEDENQTKIDE